MAEQGISKRSHSVLEQVSKAEEAKKLGFQGLVDALGSDMLDASQELGDGYHVLPNEQKHKLVAEPFVVLDYKFNEGPNGEFVTLWILTAHNDTFIVNDGSTGIYKQWREFVDRTGWTGPVMCKYGLRKPKPYTPKDSNGNPLINPSTGKEVGEVITYHLDTMS